MEYRKIASFKDLSDFSSYLKANGVEIPFDEKMEAGASAPLANSASYQGRTIGNRLCVLPMEGWDCELDGRPSELMRRRWERFGLSGAKLLWGCEAAAVRHDGRSNTRQLMIAESTVKGIASAREGLVKAHENAFGSSSDLYVGLQLTHSGRFSKPNDDKVHESRVAYRHPILDPKFHFDEKVCKVLSDDDVKVLVDDYAKAASLAQKAGFDFVDFKQCHGYLGHEFLSAVDRPGPYGGSFENRTRFIREGIQAIKAAAPGLAIGMRLSLFDFVPFKKGPDKRGVPESFEAPYRYAFGGDGTGVGWNLDETVKLLKMLRELGVSMVCGTVGSPYYVPHIQRPALYPPCDGYLPPEDPLAGVARQIKVVADVKKACPETLIVASGLTYLQELFPNVAQRIVRDGLADFAGLGRMVLPYPDIFADILAGRPLRKRSICRTFSDCTTAPRNGIVSGCYPLDDFYKAMPECQKLKGAKTK